MKIVSTVNFSEIDFKKGNGLVPVVVQDYRTRKVLMLAYMNEEALKMTLETGFAHYYSRSRRRLWKKGESSGHVQRVRRVIVDCDNDTILLQVEQSGVACHTGEYSCFHSSLKEAEQISKNFDEIMLEKVKSLFKNENLKLSSEESIEKTFYSLDPSLVLDIQEWIAEKLDKITYDNFDKVFAIDYLAIPIAQLFASKKGKSLIFFKGKVDQSKESLEVHGIRKDEAVVLIGSIISNLDHLLSVINYVKEIGAYIFDILCVSSALNSEEIEKIYKETGIKIKRVI